MIGGECICLVRLLTRQLRVGGDLNRNRCFRSEAMAGSGSSMLYSFLLFTVILSLQEMYRGKLASSELFTILGGFVSSLLFLVVLTFIGNLQETIGAKTGWGAVIVAEAVALIAASTVHRVCITTCFLFSAGLLYEVNKISGSAVSTSDTRTKKQSGRA
ncbi:hypothetical protein VNO80_18666 [Phaseolus coccineus]|uniref:Dolichyl-diphosphooligosaccharide--protein glycosyltransferase subunit KCP2 n=1 Tax=Phaseolus coccineus TaxID=3886 RepID=A0AAN9QWN4_PHACN